MRIGVIGSGYVGLVSGACFAEFGIDVVCVDNDSDKINRLKQGEIPIYEPGLDELVARQVEAGRLSFTTDKAQAVKGSDAVFLAVGTPSRMNGGDANLEYVYQAVREVAEFIEDYTVIVTKSTVPVGTAREVQKIVSEILPRDKYDVCSNPEFLREGAAINDFMRPDRVVVGVDTPRAEDVMRRLYRPLYLNETPMVVTTPETAEIVKYASNAFLATKITFINEIANLCENAGGNVQDVARAMGLDGRIGAKFLHAGPGYGGSCFPKDTKALVGIGEKFRAPQSIVQSVVNANENRRFQMAERIIAAAGGNVRGKKIAVLGIAFKPNTDDIREAPSLYIISALQEKGAIISAYDPAAMELAAKELNGDVRWAKDAYDAANDADIVVILTEWNEFRALNLKRLGEVVAQKVIMDTRNIYKLPVMEESGFDYYSIGRAPILQADEKASIKAAS